MQNVGIACDESGSHARNIGTLREAAEHDEISEIVPAQAFCRFERTQGRIIEIDFGITFVGGDDEAVLVGKIEYLFPFFHAHDAAGRICRRTQVKQLRVFPKRSGYLVEVEGEAVFGRGVEEVRRCPCKQSRAFVNLVKRIGTDDTRRRLAGIDHGMRKCEQRFPASVDRQNLGFAVERYLIAFFQPSCYGFPQRIAPLCCGIMGKTAQIPSQRISYECGSFMLRFPDRKLDRGIRGIRSDSLAKRSQALKRIGLQSC